MKKILSVVLIVVMASSLVLSGCAAETPAPAPSTPAATTAAPAPAPATTAAPAPTPAAPVKPIELKYNDFNPAGVNVTNFMTETNAEVVKRTEGRLQITNYYTASLLKYPETFKGVVDGIADFSYFLVGGTAGIQNFTTVFNLPFLGFKTYQQAIDISKAVFDKYPEFQAENAKLGVYLINIRPMLPVQIHSAKKKIVTPADLKGEKIIAEGHYSRAVVAAGGTAINMGPTDWYNALQKGVAGHTMNHFAVMYDFKIDELTKYHTMFGANGIGNGSVGFIANLGVWNSIQPGDQAIIKDEYWKYQTRMVDYDVELQEKAIAEEKAKGQEFIDLTEAQINEWAKVAGEPTIAAWIAEAEAAGYPGQAVVDDIRAQIAAYK